MAASSLGSFFLRIVEKYFLFTKPSIYVENDGRRKDLKDQRVRKVSGLGLAISKAIMELHGGKISAASKGKGTGATFRIEIKSVQD